jgi:hypothetical protein
MTNISPTDHGGTHATCTHRTSRGGFCRHCELPLHALNLGPYETIQFADAASAVAYARANYNHNRAAILTAVGR